MNYDWDFSVLRPYSRDFAHATLITIYLGVLSTLLGTAIGFLLGWLMKGSRTSSPWLMLNDALRSLPTLFLILAFNYTPWGLIFGVGSPSPFACALLALIVGQATFTADLVRGAITNINPGPVAAAHGLGLSRKAIILHIEFPDVLRQILPALGAFMVGNFKLSSLASVIGVQEIVFVARVAAGQQFRSLEAWVLVAVVYVILVTPLTIAVRACEDTPWLRRR